MIEKAICWEDIFINEQGSIYQCSNRRKIVFVFQDKIEYLRINDFFTLKKLVDAIDIEKLLLEEKNADIEIISPIFFENIFILSISDIISLKDLLEGASVMLELQTIIYERLYSVIA
ncbi:MAG: hypothetical protein EAZ20_13520 [Bacteroidetes bacterium]|nr:MAG: hypothetical protein EAZ20_13520 [Bacteroidota bacterium]